MRNFAIRFAPKCALQLYICYFSGIKLLVIWGLVVLTKAVAKGQIKP